MAVSTGLFAYSREEVGREVDRLLKAGLTVRVKEGADERGTYWQVIASKDLQRLLEEPKTPPEPSDKQIWMNTHVRLDPETMKLGEERDGGFYLVDGYGNYLFLTWGSEEVLLRKFEEARKKFGKGDE